jgi:hypothetical protein
MSIKINQFTITSLLVGLLFLTSCLDPIDLKIPKGFEETLIFQGVLVKGNPSTFDFNVTRLFDFTAESLARVNVSQVILSDDAGNSVEIERVGTGTYRAEFVPGQSPISIDVGKSYKLNVRTFDGRAYESSFEPLLQVPLIDSLGLEGVQKESVFLDGTTTSLDSFARVNVTTSTTSPNTNTPVALKWDVGRTYKLTDSPIEFGIEQKACYIYEDVDITKIKVFDGESIRGGDLESRQIFDQLFDFHISEGMYLQVVQSALSPQAFNYFNQVKQVLEREGNMFEAPAGKISTNFFNTQDPDEEVYGYFYTTTTDTARIYISPEFANFPGGRCPPPFPVNPDGSCGDITCCNCLDADDSTVLRPAYWVE